MNKLVQYGRIIFAIGIIGLAIFCMLYQDFIVGRPPAWSEGVHFPVLGYITGAILIIMSLLIIFQVKGELASLVVALLILFLSVPRHGVHFMNDWGNAYKTLALLGGTLIVACSFIRQKKETVVGISIRESAVRYVLLIGTAMVTPFFLASGYAHFKFADFVIGFIPAYIPFRAFWTYFCAVCLIAGGIGILIPRTRRLAALLSGIMVLGWFVLLHVPRFVMNPDDFSDRLGLCESFAIGGMFLVLGGMYSNRTASRRD
jgi:uncharacterized membrane protein YphA (DoxX/SURF4 family)